MNFVKWFRSEPHRDKYEADHPVFLAAREAWDASKKDRTWVRLTDEEREIASWTDGSFGAGARWAEAKLKEKNT